MDISQEIRGRIRGEVVDEGIVIKEHTYDASLFGVEPQLVVFPQDKDDIQELVRFLLEKKHNSEHYSLTARAAGTDMTGGPLTSSISLSLTKHMNAIIDLNEAEKTVRVQPGVFYRDFEKEAGPKKLFLPSYPASKSLAAFGGMIANNSAGERTLRYGKTNKFIQELKVVLADGNEYSFRKLTIDELNQKKSQDNHEGYIYREMFKLLDENYDEIKNARPNVAKNSSGYALWDIYDREAGTFDLTQLFAGSQGTLGIWSEALLRLEKEKPHKTMGVLFFDSWKNIPEVVNAILPLGQDSIEVFDDATMKLGLKFMPQIARKVGKSTASFAMKFLPEVGIGIRMLGLPKLIMLVEFAEETEEAAEEKLKSLEKEMRKFKGLIMRSLRDPEEIEKYWTIRRESFSLLRQNVSNKRTAPFVEDFCIRPELLPEFLPKILSILRSHKIRATLAGHAGEGNFHIIPLMELSKESERAKIPVVLDKVHKLIFEYGGTMSGEHNDGLLRSSYLEQMFGESIHKLFIQTKDIFDPHNLFNPGKKVHADLDFALSKIDHG